MSDLPAARFLDRTTPPHIATLILVAGVPALSMNVFLPSLPHMAEWFDTDYGVMQLSVSLYLATTAVLQLAIGPVSDRFGRRPVLIGSFVVFLAATLGCIYAPTIEVFLACRIVQASVAVGFALSRAIARDMVPGAQAASMIGYVTMGMSVVPMIGPAIGGALDEAFGWQANFWILLILGVAVLLLVQRDLGETARGPRESFRAQAAEWPELLRSPRFWGYVGAAAFASGAFFAYLGGGPFVGSEVFGLSPAALGLYFGAPAVGYFLGNGISGRFSVEVGMDRMILWGSLLTAAGLATAVLLTLAGLRSPGVFFGFMTFVGLGNGMTLPNANAGLLGVRPHLAGTAAGLGGAFMIGGGAALSAWAGALLGPGTGELPLLYLMLATSGMSVAAILYVMRRNRRLAAEDAARDAA
jgi:DHA1 family bicyclomycin/chloramphenicol resistance-like MFS transporter